MSSRMRRISLAVIVTAIIVIVGFSIIDYRFLGVGYVEEFNGLCFISDIQHTNGNVSYSVIFHGVNFTFLFYAPSVPNYIDPNGTTWTVADAPDIAYFLLTYSDGEIEHLAIYLGGYPLIDPFAPLRPVLGNHTSPRAGVANSYDVQLIRRWVLVVSF